MKPLETLTVLPMNDGGRFGSVALGFDRVDTVREEHLALVAVARHVVDPVELDPLRHAATTITDRAALPPSEVEAAVRTVAEQLLTDPAGCARSVTADHVLWLMAARVRR